MKQEKAKRNRPPPKYAVWREAGQLQCQICKALVNSENLWASHLRSVPHLRVMETLRRQLEEKKRAEAEALARARQEAEAPESESEEKHAETAVNVTAASSSTAPTTDSAAPSKENKQKEETTKKDDVGGVGSLRKESVEETTTTMKEEEKKEEDENAPKRIKLMGPLPPDALYIDQVTLAEVEEVDEKSEEAEAQEGGVLVGRGVPEGFFDNEDEEAKARGVKKPAKRREERMEMEMRKFEAQIEKEDQRMHAVRHDLDQIAFNLQSEEEILLIEELKDNAKKMREEVERLRKCENEKEENSSDSGSDIDESLLVLNWRTKGL